MEHIFKYVNVTTNKSVNLFTLDVDFARDQEKKIDIGKVRGRGRKKAPLIHLSIS